MTLLRALALFLAVMMPVRADAVGKARVIDGDAIEVQGQRIRLHGIDAPLPQHWLFAMIIR